MLGKQRNVRVVEAKRRQDRPHAQVQLLVALARKDTRRGAAALQQRRQAAVGERRNDCERRGVEHVAVGAHDDDIDVQRPRRHAGLNAERLARDGERLIEKELQVVRHALGVVRRRPRLVLRRAERGQVKARDDKSFVRAVVMRLGDLRLHRGGDHGAAAEAHQGTAVALRQNASGDRRRAELGRRTPILTHLLVQVPAQKVDGV